MSVQPIFSPFSLFATQALNPNLSLVDTLATGGLDLSTASALVDISGQGQLLSATSTLRDQLALLAAGSTPSGIGSNFGTDFGSLAAESQFFVDSFNNFQDALQGVQLNGFGSGSGTLAAEFAQSLAGQGANNPLGATLEGLAKIGINFQADPLTGNGGHLAVDLQALRTAFTKDAAGTFSTLSGAVSALRDQADTLAGQAATASGGLSAVDATLLSGLLGFSGTATGGLGLAELLALEAGGGGAAAGATQALVALNEFSLVSSLLA